MNQYLIKNGVVVAIRNEIKRGPVKKMVTRLVKPKPEPTRMVCAAPPIPASKSTSRRSRTA